MDKVKEQLNEEQLDVFNNLIEDIKDPAVRQVSLMGYAGTGKTYLLSKLVQATTLKVAMSAPTNKAVKVLMDNREELSSRVMYSTIHKLLALRLSWVYPKS